MLMCSRCHKRMAVVFITKLENGEKKNEGVCTSVWSGADGIPKWLLDLSFVRLL